MHVNNTPVSNYMAVSQLTSYIRLVDGLGTVVVTLKDKLQRTLQVSAPTRIQRR